MNIAARLLTGLALTLITGQAATAQAAPKVAGKYTFQSVMQCEATLHFAETSSGLATVVKSATLDSHGGLNTTAVNVAKWPFDVALALQQTGLMSVGTGYVTFSGAQAVVSGSTTYEGGSLRLNSRTLAVQPTNQNGTAPYIITATSFTIEGQVYQMTYGNVVAGIAHTLNMVRMASDNGNPNCLKSLTLTRM